ncbi:pantoate--beta-alanine ligase [Halonatronum saccharophilum]|uniref:pantoate--beta-alanine ligase n=1 Tax=Halonatronum saccharophilum TaxID=150060 RepID=UPI000482D8D2
MKVAKRIEEVREFILEKRNQGQRIGFVPTMGYLHQGHLSLLEEGIEDNDILVLSIFVNPTQFGEGEDYEDYPRDLDRDLELAKKVGVDLVFIPEVDQIYSKQSATTVRVEGLVDGLCGASRPGHFDGVCTIVTKLFNIVNPHRAYFGQKDAQQLAVIKRMVEDLNFDIQIVGMPIVREEDGLALSSRNKYLSKEERKAALVLSRSLELAQDLIGDGQRRANIIKEEMRNMIEKEDLAEIDYIDIVNQLNLKKVSNLEGPTLIALAVYIGETRLIDNLILEV